MSGWRKRVALVLVLLAATAGLIFWQASRTLRQAATEVRAEQQIPFQLIPLSRPVPTGYEVFSAPAVFRDAAWYGGRLYLAGSAGLSVYDSQGKLETRYRSGFELPPGRVVAVASGVAAQAGQPELFVATAGEGLLIFDGKAFRQVRATDPTLRTLTAVLALPGGSILLGTEKKGVLVYDGRSFSALHPLLAGAHITALAGGEGDVWIGTLAGGVWHWHAGQLDHFAEEDGLPDRQVLSLAVTGDAAYAGTPVGVAEFRGGRFLRRLGDGLFAQALLARGDTLTVGTLEEGVWEIPVKARPGRPPRSSDISNVQRLLELEGALYVLAGDGLYRQGRRVVEPEAGTLTDLNVAALAVDHDNRVWVGYFDRGLDILEGGRRAVHVEDDHVFCVNRVVPDPERGVTAVATANGLVIFDAAGRPRQVLGRTEGLIADHVTDVALRPGGWTVATPAGLTILDGGGARSLYAFHGLVNNHVYALGPGRSRLLVGTLGGLSMLEGEEVRAGYTTSNSALKHNWIAALVQAGDEWFVGTYGAGVQRMDSLGRLQSFADLREPFEVNPNAMAADPRHVYAGTLGRGLYVYDRAAGRWTAITAGLPSLNVTAVAAANGYVYAGTDNGLVRFPQ